MFDMFGGNAPEDPEGFDDEAELQRAADLAREADVAIVVAGEWQNMIGEAASRSSLELPGRQLELLQAVVASGTPVVLVVLHGRPVDLRWAVDNVPAILSLWYPGTQGGTAAANLLFVTSRRAASCRSPGRARLGRFAMVYSHTRSHEPDNQGRRSGMREYAAVPLRARPQLRQLQLQHLAVDRDTISPDEALTLSGRSPIPETVRQTRWYSSTSTAIRSSSRPVRELKDSSGSASEQGSPYPAVHPWPDGVSSWNAAARDWVLDASTFDVLGRR